MNSNESIHTIFSSVIDKWSEHFKKDMEPLLKVVENIHMKNNIINEILKSMPEYKLLEESNKKLIIENLELKNKLQNNIILPEDSKEVELKAPMPPLPVKVAEEPMVNGNKKTISYK